jgi:hypothetical protein
MQPYWIIVSEEGPSTRSKRHETFEKAKTESVRLAKLHPELKFDVFEYAGTTTATPAKKIVTKWVGLLENPDGTISYRMAGVDYLSKKTTLFDTEEQAEKSMAFAGSRKIGALPRKVEVETEQTVIFSLPSTDEPPKAEYRMYGTVGPIWGVVWRQKFHPFSGGSCGKQTAERACAFGAETLSGLNGKPLSECPPACPDDYYSVNTRR